MPTGRRCASCRRRRSRRSTAIPASAIRCTPPAAQRVTGYYKSVRQFGAQVRRVLLENAAQSLGRAGRRTHHRARTSWFMPSRAAARLWRDRRVRRGPRQGAGDQAERSQEAERVPPHRQGRDARRAADARSTARRNTRSTCRCPGMLYGAMLRAPVEGAGPDKIDDAKATRDPGRAEDRAAVPMASASSPKRHGRPSLRRTRSRSPGRAPARRWGFDSDKAFDGHTAFAAAARDPRNPIEIVGKGGRCAGGVRMPRRRVIESELPLRLRLSRADGAAERGRRRCRRQATAAEIWCGTQSQTDRGRRHRQGARHSDRQGQVCTTC